MDETLSKLGGSPPPIGSYFVEGTYFSLVERGSKGTPALTHTVG